MELFDVCVIGAGIEGSSTARYLASRGKKTLLLEQVISARRFCMKPSKYNYCTGTVSHNLKL